MEQRVMSKRVQPSHRLKLQQGFSFIEIMVVLVIIGVMTAAVAGKFFGKAEGARITQVRADFRTIGSQLKLYRLDNYRYPTAEQGLQALLEKPSTDPVPRQWQSGGYLDRLPLDPWGNQYFYNAPGEKEDYEIYTYGADGLVGGAGADKDLYSWDDDETSS
jgi:general secretion pathway protein G